MFRTKSDNVGIRYGALQRGLSLMLGIESGSDALRGRIRHLGALGIPGGDGPGKGSFRNYSWGDAVQLAIALMFENIGLDPVVVAAALKRTWSDLARLAMAAVEAPADNPMMLTARLETFTGPLRTGNPHASLHWISIAPRTDLRSRGQRIAIYRKRPEYAKVLAADPAMATALIEKLATYEADSALMMLERDDPGWLSISKNLTELLQTLQTAIEDTSHGRS
jgi:hypothetical protein